MDHVIAKNKVMELVRNRAKHRRLRNRKQQSHGGGFKQAKKSGTTESRKNTSQCTIEASKISEEHVISKYKVMEQVRNQQKLGDYVIAIRKVMEQASSELKNRELLNLEQPSCRAG